MMDKNERTTRTNKVGNKAGCFFCSAPNSECNFLPTEDKAKIADIISKTFQCPEIANEAVLGKAVSCHDCLEGVKKIMELEEHERNVQAQLNTLKESCERKLEASLVSDGAKREDARIGERRMLVLESIPKKNDRTEAEAEPNNSTVETSIVENQKIVYDTPLVSFNAYVGEADDSSDSSDDSDDPDSSSDSSESVSNLAGEETVSKGPDGPAEAGIDLQPNDSLGDCEIVVETETEEPVPEPAPSESNECSLPMNDIPEPSEDFKKFESMYQLRHCYIPLERCNRADRIGRALRTRRPVPVKKAWCLVSGCRKAFRSEEKRNTHILNIHLVIRFGTFKCNECRRYFYSKPLYDEHKKTHESDSVCKQCGEDCKTRSELFNHIKGHLPYATTVDIEPQPCPCTSDGIPMEGVELATDFRRCPDCGREFLYDECLTAHIEEVHRIILDVKFRRLNPKWFPCLCCSKEMFRFENPPNNLISFDCLICRKKFNKSEHTNHKEELSILCEHPTCTCKEAYTDFEKFFLHHESVCPKSYQDEACTCPTCGKLFLSERCLVSHNFNVHPTDRRYRCHLCEKGFPSRKYLWHHVRSHAPARRSPCEICGGMFNPTSLKAHKATHVSEGEEPRREFICELCGEGFTLKHRLKRHMDAHRPKDVPCPKCGKLFKHYRHVRNHIYFVHDKRGKRPNAKTVEVEGEGMGEEETYQ